MTREPCPGHEPHWKEEAVPKPQREAPTRTKNTRSGNKLSVKSARIKAESLNSHENTWFTSSTRANSASHKPRWCCRSDRITQDVPVTFNVRTPLCLFCWRQSRGLAMLGCSVVYSHNRGKHSISTDENGIPPVGHYLWVT